MTTDDLKLLSKEDLIIKCMELEQAYRSEQRWAEKYHIYSNTYEGLVKEAELRIDSLQQELDNLSTAYFDCNEIIKKLEAEKRLV